MRLAIEDEYQRLRASGQPNGNAQIVGYILVAYDGSAANATVDVVDVVDVVMTSAELVGQFILFRVTLLWAEDHWRVLASPSGSWGMVATRWVLRPPARPYPGRGCCGR